MYKSIDERNLQNYLWLNFTGVLIELLNIIHLKQILVLVLDNSKIISLDTDNLDQLVYLSLAKILLMEMNTKS